MRRDLDIPLVNEGEEMKVILFLLAWLVCVSIVAAAIYVVRLWLVRRRQRAGYAFGLTWDHAYAEGLDAYYSIQGEYHTHKNPYLKTDIRHEAWASGYIDADAQEAGDHG